MPKSHKGALKNSSLGSLQFYLCLLCTCNFIGLLCHIMYYLLRLTKYRVITCISENIFYVGEAYLSDSTNYASPSSHIARK